MRCSSLVIAFLIITLYLFSWNVSDYHVSNHNLGNLNLEHFRIYWSWNRCWSKDAVAHCWHVGLRRKSSKLTCAVCSSVGNLKSEVIRTLFSPYNLSTNYFFILIRWKFDSTLVKHLFHVLINVKQAGDENKLKHLIVNSL